MKRKFIDVKTFTNRITIKITNLKLLILSKTIKIKEYFLQMVTL